MTRARALVAAVLVICGGFGLTSCKVRPQLVVNSTVDAVDAFPGDGGCETATPGECTLRAAIQEANALGKAVDVVLASGATYALTIAGAGEDLGATGDLDTNADIHLHGNGSTIDAHLLDRVVDHHARALMLERVTLTGGQMDEGAGIRNAAALELVDSNVFANRGFFFTPSSGVGANIYHTAGTLNVVRTFVTGSSSIDAIAGGIVQQAGTVNIIDSYIASNLGYSLAYELNQLGGTAVIVNSSVRGGTTIVQLPFCSPEGCFPVDVSFNSVPMKIEGTVTIVRSTLAQGVFDGTQLMYGAGQVEASGSMLYGACTPSVTSLGYNAMRSGALCADVPQATDLLLTTGPRETLGVPNIGEPIVDAIPVGTPVLCDAANDHDQRLEPRPVGAGCDIGAVERQPGELNV